MTYKKWIILLIASACLMTVAAVPVFCEPLPQQSPTIRIGLIAGVGIKPEIPIASETPLAVLSTAGTTHILLPQGDYKARAISSTFWLLDLAQSSWDQVPEALRTAAVPYVTDKGLIALFTTDPTQVNHPDFTGKPFRSEAILAIGLYSDVNLVCVLAKGEGRIADLQNQLKVGTFRYRGTISFQVANNALTAVNHLSIEHYLYGVVPKEVSPSWPQEALKAQAVAARTYAYSGLGRFKAKGYDLTDDTLSQVYRGVGVEDVRSNRAVDETAGICAYHLGRRIDALYHSNSGGYTENSENVFVSPIPYLRGKEDPYSIGAPNDVWTVSYSPLEVEDALKKSGHQVGSVVQIVTRSLSPNGRVTKLDIEGTTKTVTLSKEQIRQVFGATRVKSLLFNVTKGDKMSVLSAAGIAPLSESFGSKVAIMGATGSVSLEKAAILGKGIVSFYPLKGQLPADSVAQEKYKFVGRGYGHGVGMSQYGAKKMAELGKSFQEILSFYYTGINFSIN